MSWDICLLVVLLCLVLSVLGMCWTKRNLSVKKGSRCLLVVAHPDDECMFFGPTVLHLKQLECKVSVLCVSTGDACGLGQLRKKEMFRSCTVLGVSSADVTIMDVSDMKDGQQRWETERLARIVLQYVEKLGINVVITFDQHGVSGHSNHVACFTALQFLYTNGWIPADTQIFVLDSVRLVRKYLGVLDLMASYFTSTFLCMSSPFPIWRAMWQHRSQLVWFRYLYMFFSRYVMINTLRRIALHRYIVKKRN